MGVGVEVFEIECSFVSVESDAVGASGTLLGWLETRWCEVCVRVMCE